MFARSTIRAAQPLKMQARRYASEATPTPTPKSGGGGGGGKAFAYLAGGAVIGLGGYYYRTSGGVPSLATAAPAKPAFTGGDQGFVSLKLAEVENINHNTKRFRFELPEGDMVSGLHVASALLTKYKGPQDEKATLRPYTPISDEGQTGFIDLMVKQYPNGPMSTHLHNMAPGQQLDFKGPLPKYPWAENKHEHIALVAGGTGITPMYQLCRAIFNNPADKTKVTLVLGNVTEEDILLKKQLSELENTYPQRFRAFYVLDQAPKEWAGGKGFISKELLKTVLPEPQSGDVKVFVCGPPGLMKAISGPKISAKDQGEVDGVLKELGYSKDQVYKF